MTSPRWKGRLDLVLLKVAGFVIIGIGCGWLIAGSLFGVGIAAFGIDVVARPTARRLPRAGALVELVLQRWRVP